MKYDENEKINIEEEIRRNRHAGVLTLHSIIPLVVMILIFVVIYFFMRGRKVESSSTEIKFLTEEQEAECSIFSGETEDSRNVIVYNGREEDCLRIAGIAASCMDTARLDYSLIDISDEDIDYDNIDLMLLCTGNLYDFGDGYGEFVKWLNTGNMLWCSFPEYNDRCSVIAQMMGIEGTNGEYKETDSFKFVGGIIPGLDGRVFESMGISDNFLAVSLEEDCKVYLEDGVTGAPLAWEYEENGRHISVMNNGIMYKENVVDGLLIHMISKHRDATVWPITNALLVYTDDFPAPQPEGYDERLKEQFGYSTQSFFMNVWWPDMKALARKYDLKYTGVLIEDYNENTEPPFERGTAGTLSRYYGAELINEGGEIALHGYNHQSLIPEGYPNEDGYKGWAKQSNMVIATKELLSYAKDIFPEVTFTAYVPPSNLLSEEGYEAIKDSLPDLKVVSGLYFDDGDTVSYCTDFNVNEDGIINVPRITSAFIMNDFNVMRAYSALFDQGVFSHFIHPDDVLDEERGALEGWEEMRDSFDASLLDIENTYPMLRGMTASSGGGAVQRKQQLQPEYFIDETSSGKRLSIKLNGFVDEAWIALCIDGAPTKTMGGNLYHIADDYYWVYCDSDEVCIEFAK